MPIDAAITAVKEVYGLADKLYQLKVLNDKNKRAALALRDFCTATNTDLNRIHKKLAGAEADEDAQDCISKLQNLFVGKGCELEALREKLEAPGAMKWISNMYNANATHSTLENTLDALRHGKSDLLQMAQVMIAAQLLNYEKESREAILFQLEQSRKGFFSRPWRSSKSNKEMTVKQTAIAPTKEDLEDVMATVDVEFGDTNNPLTKRTAAEARKRAVQRAETMRASPQGAQAKSNAADSGNCTSDVNASASGDPKADILLKETIPGTACAIEEKKLGFFGFFRRTPACKEEDKPVQQEDTESSLEGNRMEDMAARHNAGPNSTEPEAQVPVEQQVAKKKGFWPFQKTMSAEVRSGSVKDLPEVTTADTSSKNNTNVKAKPK